MAGLPRRGMFNRAAPGPHAVYEQAHGSTLVAQYALAAQRHMAEFGTTRADLAADQGGVVLPRVVQPARAAARPGDGRGGARAAADRRAAAPDGLLRRVRRRRRVPRRERGGRAPSRQAAVGVIGHGETTRNWSNGRPDLTTPVRSRRVPARSPRPASRRPTSTTPRSTTLHHHRAAHARGPRVLREGRGRPVRARRRAACRRTACCRSTPTAAGCRTTTPTCAAA